MAPVPHPPTAYTLEQLADDVVGVADHLGIGSSIIVGLSIGGMIGQALGIRHGARLDKLILSSTLIGIGRCRRRQGLGRTQCDREGARGLASQDRRHHGALAVRRLPEGRTLIPRNGSAI